MVLLLSRNQWFPARLGVRTVGVLAVLTLATLMATGSAAGQCLEVRVLDPSAAAIAGASVLIGAQEKTTDETGTAEFCDLGTPPHAVVIVAPNFQVLEDLVQKSEGRVAFTLEVLLETELIRGRDPCRSAVQHRIDGSRRRESAARISPIREPPT